MKIRPVNDQICLSRSDAARIKADHILTDANGVIVDPVDSGSAPTRRDRVDNRQEGPTHGRTLVSHPKVVLAENIVSAVTAIVLAGQRIDESIQPAPIVDQKLAGLSNELEADLPERTEGLSGQG